MAEKYIPIKIENRHAVVEGNPIIVCGNSDYFVRFAFDDEWAEYPTRTARFVYARRNKIKYHDVVFTGNTVQVPVLVSVKDVLVGVFAGNLRATTPARIPCLFSVRCGTGAPDDPTPSQYDQIMELLASAGVVVPIMTRDVAGIAKVGDNLTIDDAGRLSVDTADEVSGDNTKPITAAAVHTTVGNIEILLSTI